jgi:hypothetical protein
MYRYNPAYVQSHPARWPAQALLKWVAENRAALARDDFGRLARAFRALDPDRRGFLTLDQLRAALGGEAGALSAAELAGMTECARGGHSAFPPAASARQGERMRDCGLRSARPCKASMHETHRREPLL